MTLPQAPDDGVRLTQAVVPRLLAAPEFEHGFLVEVVAEKVAEVDPGIDMPSDVHDDIGPRTER